ncbi:MAG: hypothetical protein RL385_630 [Pseudomonadota bacterium]|jgi:hypothetical protein
MARLYTNENFPQPAVDALRKLGHDVLTTHEAGNSNTRIPDEEVVQYATAHNRVVVTLNRKDFIRIHRADGNHCGIIVCWVDVDFVRLASRVDAELAQQPAVSGQLLKVQRASPEKAAVTAPSAH